MGNLQDYGFPFNSVASDRTYNAADWRDYFNAVVEGGVIEGLGDELEVTAQLSPDKSVLVKTGNIIINGAMREVSSDITINISDNTSGTTRTDTIVARLDYTNRLIEFDVLEGSTTLTQDTSTHEIALAEITLENGFSTITNAEITDKRDYLTWRFLEDAIGSLDFNNFVSVATTAASGTSTTLLNITSGSGWLVGGFVGQRDATYSIRITVDGVAKTYSPSSMIVPNATLKFLNIPTARYKESLKVECLDVTGSYSVAAQVYYIPD